MVNIRSLESIVDAVKGATGPVVFHSQFSPNPFAVPTATNQPRGEASDRSHQIESATRICLDQYRGIVEHDSDDQVVVVRAGTPVSELQEDLARVGQCLPMPMLGSSEAKAVAASYGSLAEEIGLNLPHGLSAQCGSWRDWVLGMKVVLADGTVVKCGSKAVKNVAGYDVQKLMIGARGTLGLIVEVTLKTFPLKALPNSELEFVSTAAANWIQRVQASSFHAAVRSGSGYLTAFDPKSSTIWAKVDSDSSLHRFEGDWVLRAGCGSKNLEFKDPTMIRLMKRTKELFDPTNKLNPGEMGVV